MTIGEDGATIPANTLVDEELKIVSNGIDLLSILKCTRINYDYITVTTRTSTIPYTIGEKPTFIIVRALQTFDNYEDYSAIIGVTVVSGKCYTYIEPKPINYCVFVTYMIKDSIGGSRSPSPNEAYGGKIGVESMELKIGNATYHMLKEGIEYEIITMA